MRIAQSDKIFLLKNSRRRSIHMLARFCSFLSYFKTFPARSRAMDIAAGITR